MAQHKEEIKDSFRRHWTIIWKDSSYLNPKSEMYDIQVQVKGGNGFFMTFVCEYIKSIAPFHAILRKWGQELSSISAFAFEKSGIQLEMRTSFFGHKK